MKLFKKLAALVVTAVVALTSVQVTAAAAKEIIDNEQVVTGTLPENGDALKYYFTPAAESVAVIDLTVSASKYYCQLLTEKGKAVSCNGTKVTDGKASSTASLYFWNADRDNGEVTRSYTVKGGTTYMVSIKLGKDAIGSGDFTLKVNYATKGWKKRATPISFGKEYKTDLDTYKECDFYKLTVDKPGRICVQTDSYIKKNAVVLYDEEANYVPVDSTTKKIGTISQGDHGSTYSSFTWDSSKERSSGKTYFKVQPGAYYLKLENKSGSSGSGIIKFLASFTEYTNGAISGFTISLNKGASVQLGALTNPADADVEWSSSDAKIATVSDLGKVTAKKSGKAVITAKSGTSKMEITIIVK